MDGDRPVAARVFGFSVVSRLARGLDCGDLIAFVVAKMHAGVLCGIRQAAKPLSSQRPRRITLRKLRLTPMARGAARRPKGRWENHGPARPAAAAPAAY